MDACRKSSRRNALALVTSSASNALPTTSTPTAVSVVSFKGVAGDTHGAVLHLLAVRDIRPAIAIYTKAGMHREAAALATAKLLPGDPAAVAAQAAHGKALHDIGNFEASAAQYLAGKSPGGLLDSHDRHSADMTAHVYEYSAGKPLLAWDCMQAHPGVMYEHSLSQT